MTVQEIKDKFKYYNQVLNTNVNDPYQMNLNIVKQAHRFCHDIGLCDYTYNLWTVEGIFESSIRVLQCKKQSTLPGILQQIFFELDNENFCKFTKSYQLPK